MKTARRQMRRVNVRRSNMRIRARPAGAIHIGHFGKVYDMDGKSDRSVDAKRRAMKAGMRRTANPHYHHGRLIRKSTTYFESRRNRADRNKKSRL